VPSGCVEQPANRVWRRLGGALWQGGGASVEMPACVSFFYFAFYLCISPSRRACAATSRWAVVLELLSGSSSQCACAGSARPARRVSARLGAAAGSAPAFAAAGAHSAGGPALARRGGAAARPVAVRAALPVLRLQLAVGQVRAGSLDRGLGVEEAVGKGGQKKGGGGGYVCQGASERILRTPRLPHIF
jgi:hypothetical protein